MFKFSFTKGQKVAKIVDISDNLVGYLRLFEKGQDQLTENEKELKTLIKKSTLSKDEKKRFKKIMSEIMKKTEDESHISPQLDKYLKSPNELVLPAKYKLVQMSAAPHYVDSKRSTFYIPGRSGSGKTRWIADYLRDYLDQYPTNDILLFTGITKPDPSLEQFGDKITTMDLTYYRDNPVTSESELEEYKDTLCIFDDINSIPDKRTRDNILTLRNMILQGGRHFNVSCMVTSHIALDNNLTKFPLKESDFYVVFPSANKMQVSSILEKYAQMSKKEVARIKKLDTRWVQISLFNPMYVLYQKGAYIIDE